MSESQPARVETYADARARRESARADLAQQAIRATRNEDTAAAFTGTGEPYCGAAALVGAGGLVSRRRRIVAGEPVPPAFEPRHGRLILLFLGVPAIAVVAFWVLCAFWTELATVRAPLIAGVGQ